MTAFIQVFWAGIITGSLYGLLALGVVLIYRTTGVLNFAYGAIGATSVSFMYILMTGPHFSYGIALIATLVFAAVLGIVLERLFARPVLNAPVFTKAIATLALALVLQTIAMQIWPQLTQSQRFATPFDGLSTHVGRVYFTLTDGIVLLVTGISMAALYLFLSRTRLGIAMRAVSDSLTASRLMGVPVGVVFMVTWGLGAVLSALAGVMLASKTNIVTIQMLDPVLILGFIGAVIGGLESIPGALIGGILVGLIESLLSLVMAGHTLGPLPLSDPGIRESLIFGGFVVLLLIRPQGFFGQRLLRRV